MMIKESVFLKSSLIVVCIWNSERVGAAWLAESSRLGVCVVIHVNVEKNYGILLCIWIDEIFCLADTLNNEGYVWVLPVWWHRCLKINASLLFVRINRRLGIQSIITRHYCKFWTRWQNELWILNLLIDLVYFFSFLNLGFNFLNSIFCDISFRSDTLIIELKR